MSEFTRIRPRNLEKLGLNDQPFRISADPRFLYISPEINGVINRYLDLMEYEEGLGVILGDVGVGKTSLARRLFDIANAEDNNFRPIFLHTATYSTAFIAAREISRALGIPTRRTYKDQLNEIEKWILAIRSQGANPVLFIDDAHFMSVDALNTIQNLINFDARSKAIQIILFGQLELGAILALEETKSIYKRIVVWETLVNFPLARMIEMLNWRVEIAGRKSPLFTSEALREIYRISAGNPRDSVNLSNEALRRTLLSEKDKIDLQTVLEVTKAYETRLPGFEDENLDS
ncbi:AAA family ATPase [bacterium]|nr:AAA family ATPase [bacterium]